jgi:glyoxylase-like metal-dependent hydrolase (beta-lactamase superfamily II)
MEIYYGLLNTPAEGILEPFIQGFNIKNTKISKTIEDNEIIEIDKNFRLKVLHTPGHSAGHCCFYEENLKIIFLADIDLTRFTFYGSMDSNLVNFEESIEKLKKLDIEIAISSHKGVFKGKKLIKEELNKYLSIIYKRDERILSHLSEMTPLNKKLIKEELNKYLSIIYKRDERILSHLSEMTPLNSLDLMNKNIIYKKYSEFGKVFETISERIMIEKHFEKFLKNKIIEKKNNGYILS